MKNNLPLKSHQRAFEDCFLKFPFVFLSEVEALRQMLPPENARRGLEVCLSSGFFSEALGIKEGVEPSPSLRFLASARGIEVRDGTAENLPYPEHQFDFVLMAVCMHCFNDLHVAFGEAYRILKDDGILIIGFIDSNSTIGIELKQQQSNHPFYQQAICYSVEKVVYELNLSGFHFLNFCQTLFQPLEKIKSLEVPIPGYGKASFVVIQARKVEKNY